MENIFRLIKVVHQHFNISILILFLLKTSWILQGKKLNCNLKKILAPEFFWLFGMSKEILP